jgi:hypothetical protein
MLYINLVSYKKSFITYKLSHICNLLHISFVTYNFCYHNFVLYNVTLHPHDGGGRKVGETALISRQMLRIKIVNLNRFNKDAAKHSYPFMFFDLNIICSSL